MSETPEQKVIRRARALVQEVRDRLDRFEDAKKAFKDGTGQYHYGGPVLADFFSYFNGLWDACDEAEGVKETQRKKYKATTIKDKGAFDGEMREEHESFGVIRISRISHGGSGTHLFGSHLPAHPTTIMLTVNRAQRIHSNLAYDRYHYASGKDYHVVEVEMSAAQFADMITNPNIGVGFPCTLRQVAGIQMEEVPTEHKSEQTHILDNFARDMGSIETTYQPLMEEAAEILSKKSIGKGDRKQLERLFAQIVKQIEDHAPFVLKQFGEATEKMGNAAKKEVEAYATSVIHAAGLERLRGLQSEAIDTEAVESKLAQLDAAIEKERGDTSEETE